jgi:hypothetical protein
MNNKYSMPEGEKYGQRGVILYFSPSCIWYSNQQARARKNLARGKMILFLIMLIFRRYFVCIKVEQLWYGLEGKYGRRWKEYHIFSLS